MKSRKYAKYLRFAAQLVYRVPYTNRQRPWEVLGTRLSVTYARHRSYLRSLELVLSFLCRSVICCANLCHLLICDILWSWEESIRRRTKMTKNTRVNQGPKWKGLVKRKVRKEVRKGKDGQLYRAVVRHLITITKRTNVCRSISDSDVNPWQNADTRHFKISTSDWEPPLPGRASVIVALS